MNPRARASRTHRRIVEWGTPITSPTARVGIGSRQTGAELAARMDDAGVDLACIFPHVEAGFDNDDVDRAMAQRPGRFIPFMAVNPWYGQAAVAEIHERAARGYRGINCIRPSTATTSVTSRSSLPCSPPRATTGCSCSRTVRRMC